MSSSELEKKSGSVNSFGKSRRKEVKGEVLDLDFEDGVIETPLARRKLTRKQLDFARAYVDLDRDGKQALFAAGYAPTVSVDKVLESISLGEEISRLQDIKDRNGEINNAWVLDKFKSITERCMQEEPVRDRHGNPTGEYRFDASSALRALESLSKFVGLYEADNKQKAQSTQMNIQNNHLGKLSMEELVEYRRMNSLIGKGNADDNGDDND